MRSAQLAAKKHLNWQLGGVMEHFESIFEILDSRCPRTRKRPLQGTQTKGAKL